MLDFQMGHYVLIGAYSKSCGNISDGITSWQHTRMRREQILKGRVDVVDCRGGLETAWWFLFLQVPGNTGPC